MKILQYAIASIIDANTGYGMSLTSEQHHRTLAAQGLLSRIAGLVASYLQYTGLRVARATRAIGQNLRQRRELRRLGSLNEHLLEDIGLARGDLLAAELGQISMAELESRRFGEAGNKPVIKHRNITDASIPQTLEASNESLFATAKCA